MADIKVISTDTVPAAAASGASPHRIELTPWDLQLLLVGPIQKGLLFLKPTPPPQPQDQHFSVVVQHLKLSLSRTLDFFPPLAGRLGVSHNADGTSSFFVHCNNAGADFVHAVAENVTVADILEPVFVPRIVPSFFPLNGVYNFHGVSIPLMAVQVTELLDGFFIGCTMNHSIGDGSSFWNFFNSWSEISRGSLSISRPPVLDRWFPGDTKPPISIPFCSDQIQDKFILPPMEERVFHFPKEKIAELKAKANAEMESTTISSLQALLAHLWRSVARCLQLNSAQELRYMLPIGARSRLQPALPETYFGNSLVMEILTATAGELRREGLGRAAWRLNRAICSKTSEEVVELFKSWVENPKMPTLDGLTGNCLITSSSPRFNVYGNDFGWGKPVAVRSGAGNKRDGKLTIFPGAAEGSIDIEVCLSSEKMATLGDDEEFMAAVKV
ncbi:uncharacterized acetyltransferase At3g50280-like [Diospyros lotus]|uniref:uncharacterized acetyltransferase At3g50280-like n=1 Tax=Diospyros lotus TaxID=55363 RepID=UPI002255C2AA|nr:uncharacterized acetyltransferase At3g50280-like [Diospyros lotus]